MIKILVTDLEDLEHEIEGREGDRLMEVLREYDWGVAAICGGMCSCGTCHVYVDDAWRGRFPERDIDEEELVELLEYSREDSRLSCQLNLAAEHDGLRVTLAPEE